MKKYYVLVSEVHVSTMEIEAETPEEALEKVAEGEGDEIICEYSYTLEPDSWKVEEVQ